MKHATRDSKTGEAAGPPRERRESRDFGLLGNSPSMRSLRADLGKVGASDAPVLITGESGTGKELAARAIHAASRYSSGPCIEVNCGALPAGIIQSELFGYEKGAFTGAGQRKIGRIEAADGGLLFLDEIGDLPLELQVNLLRFIQEKAIERIGGTRKIGVDTRIVAATHMDLEAAVKAGSFREDLYYRLNVLRVHMPPLRERGRDIEELAWNFLERFAREAGTSARGFSPGALKAMRRHDWPGNVRELINRVRRAVVMCEGQMIDEECLGLGSTRAPTIVTLEEAREKAESQALERALVESEGNVTLAARLLNVSRRTLYRLMEKHHLNQPF